MPSKTEIAQARAEVADLKERIDALEQTGAIFEANLALAMDMARGLVEAGRDAMVRLSKVEAQHGSREHERKEVVQALKLSLDWLDRIDPTMAKGRA